MSFLIWLVLFVITLAAILAHKHEERRQKLHMFLAYLIGLDHPRVARLQGLLTAGALAAPTIPLLLFGLTGDPNWLSLHVGVEVADIVFTHIVPSSLGHGTSPGLRTSILFNTPTTIAWSVYAGPEVVFVQGWAYFSIGLIGFATSLWGGLYAGKRFHFLTLATT